MTLLTYDENSWWVQACKEHGIRPEKAKKEQYR